MARDKIVIFGQNRFYISVLLTKSLLHLVEADYHGKYDVYIVPTDKVLIRTGPVRMFKYLTKEIILKCFGCKEYKMLHWSHLLSLERLAKANRNINFVVPHNNNVNCPEFLDFLGDISPTIGFSLGASSIFKKELIDQFDTIVNYHNSLLPNYKGTFATHWSMYNREYRSGFTFHLIIEELDSGNILVQDHLEIDDTSSVNFVEFQKTLLASKYISQAFEMVLNKNNGQPQMGQGSTYKTKDVRNIISIECPSKITSQELLHRLRCFGRLNISMRDRLVNNVTDLKKTGVEGQLSFKTQDGIILEITKISQLPVKLYNFLFSEPVKI